MKTQVFWVVTPCCWVSSFLRFEGFLKGSKRWDPIIQRHGIAPQRIITLRNMAV